MDMPGEKEQEIYAERAGGALRRGIDDGRLPGKREAAKSTPGHPAADFKGIGL